ncbi:MAG: hypothetical protein IJ799_02280 [Bacteroidales bacterium]|nr:hypothetical protein [Bacteroidales bacterium]
MKDIVITTAKLKRELWILLGAFVVAYGMNIYAVIHYVRPAKELYMTIGYVIVTAIVIYLLLWVVRLIVLLFVRLFTKKK